MELFLKVKTGCREENVEKDDDNHFIVSVKERPVKGLANKAVVRALANYLKVPKAEVQIISGFRSRKKVIRIK